MKKLLIVLSLSILSTSLWSVDTAKFDEHKKMMLAELDKAISTMQTERSCVDSAKAFDEVKKCRETAKSEREKMQAERKQMRVQKIDEQIKKLQDEKAKQQPSK